MTRCHGLFLLVGAATLHQPMSSVHFLNDKYDNSVVFGLIVMLQSAQENTAVAVSTITKLRIVSEGRVGDTFMSH